MPRRIIIDTDPGLDDAVAILLALAASDELEVLGIVAVAGNLPLTQTERNARRVCELVGRRDIRVHAGCARPMSRLLATAEQIHAETDHERLLLPEPSMPRQEQHGVDYLIETLQAPAALGGIIIAVVVATPEAITAVRAAAANHMQRSINIFLGSVLSTIGLTVPAIVLVSRVSGREVVLGLEHTDLVMLLLTLSVCIVTFSSGRTNVMQGAVHLVLFLVYLALILQG